MAQNPVSFPHWNGFRGALSFTFDDAMESQILSLKPLLDKFGIKATFFVCGCSEFFQKHPEEFAKLAQEGHEIGNHTASHGHLPQMDDEDLQREIEGFRQTLQCQLNDAGKINLGRDFHPVEITSFATPYCENSERVKRVIAQGHHLNRDCGGLIYNQWNEEPDWYSIRALAWHRKEQAVKSIKASIDKTEEGAWLTLLYHGVTNNDDPYAIDIRDMEEILRYAKSKHLWIAPFGTIGKYYQKNFLTH